MNTQEWTLDYYIAENGRVFFQEWFDSLNLQVQVLISARFARLRLGNFGQCKSVGHGVFELKIDYGPGYRVYLGRAGVKTVLLLCGGDKSTQKKDILTAHCYWLNFKEKLK